MQAITPSAAPPAMNPSNGVEGYTKMIITIVLTVVGSWATVRNEIHGYIDTKMDEVSRDMLTSIAHQAGGQMLLVMDSTLASLQHFQDSTNTRLDRIELQTNAPSVNRTLVLPPDTVALNEVLRRMRSIEQSIEYMIDGIERPKRAHNFQPL